MTNHRSTSTTSTSTGAGNDEPARRPVAVYVRGRGKSAARRFRCLAAQARVAYGPTTLVAVYVDPPGEQDQLTVLQARVRLGDLHAVVADSTDLDRAAAGAATMVLAQVERGRLDEAVLDGCRHNAATLDLGATAASRFPGTERAEAITLANAVVDAGEADPGLSYAVRAARCARALDLLEAVGRL